MSAPFIIPFNFQPESISVKTASYTVPAGKYAYITANVIGAATFTIGGATAISGNASTLLSSTTLDLGGTTGSLLTNTTLGAGTNAFTSTTVNTTETASFWAPSGTVINGTGTWRATVSIYSNIQ